MPKIVVSYRRADSAAIAGRIFDRLTGQYGDASVFMDVDNIPFGTDFRRHIQQVLATSDVFVAVVGPRWAGEDGSRIKEAADPVRVEVETALQRGMPVIPLLVDGARMPTPAELPESVQAFAYLNAAPVDIGRDFRLHMERVIRSIDSIAAGTPGTLGQPPAAPAKHGRGRLRLGLAGAAAVAVVVAAVWVFAPASWWGAGTPPAAPAAPRGADFPGYRGRVSDETGMLHAASITALSQRLAELEAKSGTQVVAAMLRVLPAVPLTTFASELAQRWKVGGATRNGVLLLVFPEARRIVLDVGSGARDRLGSGEAIVRNAEQRLAAGDVIGALMGAVDDLAGALTQGRAPGAPAVPQAVAPPAPPPVTYRVIDRVSGGVQNMRSGPATKYPIVVAIPAGSTGITISGCRASEDGTRPWCAANWRTYAGWISSCCIVEEKTGAPPRVD